jgi:CheY-like chemotaxis protein
MIGLVPITLSSELRSMLRRHFRLVINKPLHHDMLLRMLASSGTQVPATKSTDSTAERFDLCILIVEDNAVNQRLIQQVVTNLGCTWISVANGRAAVEELRRTAPDVVLMDLHMPELDGLAATMKIRAGESGDARRDVWIIALTADAREEQRMHTLAAGANDYLTKPVRLPELTAALRRFMQERRSGRREN